MSYKRNTTYKPYTTNTTYPLAEFIRSWDFANPRWKNLPDGFPHCDTGGLTAKEEWHLFGAIKLAWIVSGGGRQIFYRAVARKALVGVTVVILIILLGRTLTASPYKGVTRSVNAKTVTAAFEDIVESTRSALFR